MIKPISESKELVQVGQQLRNCAANYDRQIIEQRSAMMVCTDPDGKPLALCEVRFNGRGANRTIEVGQIAGPCNSPVSLEMRGAFLNCLAGLTSSEAP